MAQPCQDSAAAFDRIEKSIWDLANSADKEQRSQRSIVRWTWSRIKQDAWIASDKAIFLATELAKVFMPAYVCSVYVRRDPSWQAVNSSFAPMALEMIRLSNAGSVLTLSLIPNGVIYTMVPLKGSTPDDDPNWRAIGKDWLQDKFNEDKVLHAIDTSDLTIIGPYNLTQGGIGLVAMLSIRIPNASPNDTFNIPTYVHGNLGSWQKPPRQQDGPNTTDTPFAPYMYNYSTGSKWWGLTTVLISWDILRERVMRLQELEGLGYRYVLSRPALQKELLRAKLDMGNGSHELAVAWSANVQSVGPDATNNNAKPTRPGEARPLIYYDLHKKLSKPAEARISVEGAEMTLFLEPAAGWAPEWRNPLLAVVAVGSLLVAAMLFTILVNRRQHLGLLHAMIPKKVISTIRRGDIFTESFDCVTILFSDIVSYTSMSAQMAPIEVVQMLDELYKEYDNLTEKHKLYKVETIGGELLRQEGGQITKITLAGRKQNKTERVYAFMVVGGAPDPMAPHEAARRVAQMALDMVELTRTRVLSGGQVLRIRVGIHSGPVVAAVVGRKMPRYCLFGDTVNTANRMESNGSPMRIHVSAATANLLQQAAGFVLEARGDVPIKGKGSMSTFWVTSSAGNLAAPQPSLGPSLSGPMPDDTTNRNTPPQQPPSSYFPQDPAVALPSARDNAGQGQVQLAAACLKQQLLFEERADGGGSGRGVGVVGAGNAATSPPLLLVRPLPSTSRLSALAVRLRDPENSLDSGGGGKCAPRVFISAKAMAWTAGSPAHLTTRAPDAEEEAYDCCPAAHFAFQAARYCPPLPLKAASPDRTAVRHAANCTATPIDRILKTLDAHVARWMCKRMING
ncbi:guanylyl and adenylyl cyclase family member [Volvox carteri f. nagariensis]|uniref:Guanylyl and adenylyl cyclase family member n=1 Tax=Volvox carteri f. nagariensis TaxID=3068 RepID=D8TRY2_VOLCA|nr:guanylyl and adenylyl cyclase family member [Volvox carteri f. nagariensis]EFJ49728.1 guanylyl and adenylyl cyclase family member [Volvox carteri f. nagariensis]|eukprot:XP_002949235.1 guanylyl and adenylyl cyclase family member [Volvox carteri f. nagariensis]